MTSARKRRARERGPGLVGDSFRLLAAAALLGAVAVLTVTGVSSTSAKAQQNHVRDRANLAKAFAGPLTDGLAGAYAAANSAAFGASPAGWDMLRVDRNGLFTGTSGRYLSLSGPAVAHPCPAGAGLRELVDAAGRTAAPVALVLNPPGSCEPVLGAARAIPGGTVVVTTDLDPFLARAAVAARLGEVPEGGIRTFIVDPGGALLAPGQDVRAVPGYLASFAGAVSSGRAETAHARDTRHASVFDAGASLAGGWSLVLEQDSAAFDVGPVVRPSRVVAVVVGALFAAVLLLQAWSDTRRRRATRRAEAHTAAFLAVLGHELRTPLTVIKGFVDTLSSRWGELLDDQRHELVDRMQPQSRRLNRVVERLLLAANLQAGSAPRPVMASVAIAPALERVADEFEPLAPLHQFVVDALPDVTARADPTALEQLLDQLVDNAVRYSPSGGTVRLAAVRRRGRVEVAVEDDGVGLPPDADSIFDAFAQGESVEGRVHDEGGVGVGLYIVRTLCEQLGGSVRAERRSAGGARFVVTLRAHRDRAAARV